VAVCARIQLDACDETEAHGIQHGKAQTVFTEYRYDDQKMWLVDSVITYLDQDDFDTLSSRVTDTATLITSYEYDGDFNLCRTVSPTGNTVYYLYDSLNHAFLWKTIDSTLGGVIQERRYYANGQDSVIIGRNGEETFYYYDRFGRDSLVKRPLETDYSVKSTYDNPNRKRTWLTKIDTDLATTTSVTNDALLRPIKRSVKVNDSVSVTDALVYNDLEALSRWGGRCSTMRLIPHGRSTSMTNNCGATRRFSPDSTLSDSVTYQDYFTTDYRSETGLKTRQVTDFFGNVTFSYIGAETTTSFTPIDTTWGSVRAARESYRKP